ncbi:hypothetical protein PMAYCL1PPCAC_05542 [Pristionchus mayeri]|uniref:Membrane transporter n=1 Tax=Pristionchus mayeri TaxID=1317129 RepID=A0AAN4Z6B1_9BILA|nr:hypothetical protein PMAYCL1PPCAC_05542 [Pristionchus mayeri]
MCSSVFPTRLSTLISFVTFAGMLPATFLVPFLIQLLKSQPLGLPLIYAVTAIVQTFNYILELSMVTKSLPLFLASFIIEGLFNCAHGLAHIQLILFVIPVNQRSSALALSKMMTAIANMPSAQMFGAISDYFRSDSTFTSDHLNALQDTFLYTWPITLASAVLCFVLLRFYRKDAEKTKEMNTRYGEESAPLIAKISITMVVD